MLKCAVSWCYETTDNISIYCINKHRCTYPKCFYKRTSYNNTCDLHNLPSINKCNTKGCENMGPRCWKCRNQDRSKSHGYDKFGHVGYYISSTDFECNKTGRCKLYDRCGKWCSIHQKCIECKGPRNLEIRKMRCDKCRCAHESCGRSARNCTRHHP